MDKRLDSQTGIAIKTTQRKFIIEVPITNMVRGFLHDPNNSWNEKPIAKIHKGMRRDFVEWMADFITDECDPDTGDNYLMKMFGELFERMIEEAPDFLKYSDEEEDE